MKKQWIVFFVLSLLCAANFNTGGPGGMIVACNDNAMDWTQDFNANRCGNDAGIRGYLTS